MVMTVALILWLMMNARRGLYANLPWLVFMVTVLLSSAYARLFSSREPQMQLWMTEEGFAEVVSTPEARNAEWLVSTVRYLVFPMLFLPILFATPDPIGPVGIGVLAALVVWAAIVV